MVRAPGRLRDHLVTIILVTSIVAQARFARAARTPAACAEALPSVPTGVSKARGLMRSELRIDVSDRYVCRS